MQVIQLRPDEVWRRKREMQRYQEIFAKELFHAYCLAPHPGFVVDLITGEYRLLPLANEWKERNENREKMRGEYLKIHFPEFYVD